MDGDHSNESVSNITCSILRKRLILSPRVAFAASFHGENGITTHLLLSRIAAKLNRVLRSSKRVTCETPGWDAGAVYTSTLVTVWLELSGLKLEHTHTPDQWGKSCIWQLEVFIRGELLRRNPLISNNGLWTAGPEVAAVKLFIASLTQHL